MNSNCSNEINSTHAISANARNQRTNKEYLYSGLTFIYKTRIFSVLIASYSKSSPCSKQPYIIIVYALIDVIMSYLDYI